MSAPLNILLLGSGGREHALAWKIRSSPRCKDLYIAPGNTGTALCGTNLDISPTDFEAVKLICKSKKIGLLVVGPEDPLVMGLVDELKSDPELKELLIIGPAKEAARLEGSKAYAKAFMQRHAIPTAAYREFSPANYEDGIKYLTHHGLPIVLKADGLAAGKGVVICENKEDALEEFRMMLKESKFGEAGNKVVVEQFLSGIELSVFALTDGKNYVLLPEAKDYKRIGEGDKGLNTGGMGAISPVPFADDAFMKKVVEKIVEPTIAGLHKENMDYRGFVFFGLIKVGEEPYVIEYNCRMGDPETEVVMPRLKSDLVELLVAAASCNLSGVKVEHEKKSAATIVAVSGGYPGDFTKGHVITGLDTEEKGCIVFHAGTKESNGDIITNGGRVFCVTSFGENVTEATDVSKQVMDKISFAGKYYRQDIGYEFKTVAAKKQ